MSEKELAFVPGSIVITRKNFWPGLFSRLPYPLALLLLVTGFLGAITRTPPNGLTIPGYRTIVIFLLCLTLWVWGRIPLVITSLLAIILLPMCGVIKASRAYALFGNEAVFFILGAFILAAALMASGLSARIALAILERTGHTPQKLLLSVFLLNTCLAFFMSEHAVSAMTFPIIVELARALKLKPKQSRYGVALFLAMAWGSSIGGITTFLGGARAALAVGILREMTGQNISFFEWLVAALPITLSLIGVGYLLIRRWFPIDIDSIKQARMLLRAKNNQLGAISYEELAVAGITIVTVAAWITLGENYGLANISLAAVIALFAFRAVKWKDIEQNVNWGVIWMYGGSICLGATLSETGAAKWLADQTIARWSAHPIVFIMLMSFAAFALTEIMSHSAVVVALMPVAIPAATAAHIAPHIIVYAVAIPAGLAFALPMGTPANAIAYSSGFLERKDMFIPGMIFGLLSWAIFNIIAIFVWPILGIK